MAPHIDYWWKYLWLCCIKLYDEIECKYMDRLGYENWTHVHVWFTVHQQGQRKAAKLAIQIFSSKNVVSITWSLKTAALYKQHCTVSLKAETWEITTCNVIRLKTTAVLVPTLRWGLITREVAVFSSAWNYSLAWSTPREYGKWQLVLINTFIGPCCKQICGKGQSANFFAN